MREKYKNKLKIVKFTLHLLKNLSAEAYMFLNLFIEALSIYSRNERVGERVLPLALNSHEKF